MTQWAIVGQFSPASYQHAAPAGHDGNQISMSAAVVYIDDTTSGAGGALVQIGTSGVADINTRSFDIADLLDPGVIRQHIINSVIEVGAALTSFGNPRNYTIDEAHISFIPPDLPFPALPEGIPSGVIAVITDAASIPSGWALCDGTNGTPDLTDVFRPKDHAVYIQKL